MTSAVLPLSSYQADFVTGKEALHAYIEILAVGLVGPVGNISQHLQTVKVPRANPTKPFSRPSCSLQNRYFLEPRPRGHHM